MTVVEAGAGAWSMFKPSAGDALSGSSQASVNGSVTPKFGPS